MMLLALFLGVTFGSPLFLLSRLVIYMVRRPFVTLVNRVVIGDTTTMLLDSKSMNIVSRKYVAYLLRYFSHSSNLSATFVSLVVIAFHMVQCQDAIDGLHPSFTFL